MRALNKQTIFADISYFNENVSKSEKDHKRRPILCLAWTQKVPE